MAGGRSPVPLVANGEKTCASGLGRETLAGVRGGFWGMGRIRPFGKIQAQLAFVKLF